MGRIYRYLSKGVKANIRAGPRAEEGQSKGHGCGSVRADQAETRSNLMIVTGWS